MNRILVADDEQYISSLIGDCLSAEGYDIVTADNGLLAYQLFKQSAFDLVITDIIMPEMDGLELIKKIKDENPETKIIAISAGGDLLQADVYLNPAKTFGADKRNNKPFDLDDLVANVVELIGESQ
jgi:CheY-like chemotaxis protein